MDANANFICNRARCSFGWSPVVRLLASAAESRVLISRRSSSGLDQIKHALVVACSLYRIDHDAAPIWGSNCYWTLHWATLAVVQYQFCPSADCPR